MLDKLSEVTVHYKYGTVEMLINITIISIYIVTICYFIYCYISQPSLGFKTIVNFIRIHNYERNNYSHITVS